MIEFTMKDFEECRRKMHAYWKSKGIDPDTLAVPALAGLYRRFVDGRFLDKYAFLKKKLRKLIE